MSHKSFKLLACCCFTEESIPVETIEVCLGDFLVFLRRVATSHTMQGKMAAPKWTKLLLRIAGHSKNSSKFICSCVSPSTACRTLFSWLVILGIFLSLRTRLLGLRLLELVLPAIAPEDHSQVSYNGQCPLTTVHLKAYRTNQ